MTGIFGTYFSKMRKLSRIRRRPRRNVTILCYHRVTHLDYDPQLLSVTPKHFSEQLSVLRRRFGLARLRSWESDQEGKRSHSVVVTFDDGYADNLQEALPLLRAADCPATIFITAGKVASNTEFWWDELERLLLIPDKLPETLALAIDGREYTWRVGAGSRNFSRSAQWHVLLDCDYTPAQAAYLDLCALLRKVQEVERCRILEEIRRWARLDREVRPSHRPLTRDEVGMLASNDLIEIGAHSVNHPSLAALPSAVQREEIFGSKEKLQKMAGTVIESFAYPFGGSNNFSSETMRLVRAAGYRAACGGWAGLLPEEVDLYSLPRFLIRDWTGEEFERRLDAAFSQ